MTILQVVKDVCAVVGVPVPQSVFSNITGNRTMQEMLALANEMAQRIAYNTREWSQLKKTATITGDGVTTAFDLPANYKRMLLTSNVWRATSPQQPMHFVPDTDEWMKRRSSSFYDNSSWGEWTMFGGQMHIYPPLANEYPVWANNTSYPAGAIARDAVDGSIWRSVATHTSSAPPMTFAQERAFGLWNDRLTTTYDAYFTYLDKNCIALNSGGFGDVFMNDLDTFVLDERLLKLGMIWQWKAQKGSAYAEDMGTYGDALTYAMGNDSPAPILIDRKRVSNGGWGGSI